MLRNLVFLLAGFLLGASASFSYAETIPAVSASLYRADFNSYSTPLIHASASDSCAALIVVLKSWKADAVLNSTSAGTTSGQCHFSANGGYTYMGTWARGTSSVCPSGQNWTLNGTTCIRPDCVSPQVRDLSDGVCKAPAKECTPYADGNVLPMAQPSDCTCPASTKWVAGSGCRKTCGSDAGVQAGASANAGWDFEFDSGTSETGCFAGCGIQSGGSPSLLLKNGKVLAPATYTGWACGGNGVGTPIAPAPMPDNSKLDETKKKPPICGTGDAVGTTSAGKVLCLPAGTPNAATPVVAQKKAVETFPDNSTKTTTQTTTTDPNTKATDSQSTTVTTGGMSGAAGTSTTKEGTSSDGNGDGKPDGGGGSFGEYGELYKKKYPDGIKGVLDQKLAGFKSSGVYSTINQLVPTTLPNSGTCPSYSFSMNIGPKMMFGSSKLDMPCAVWSFIRIVLLITASLVARRLVFGG